MGNTGREYKSGQYPFNGPTIPGEENPKYVSGQYPFNDSTIPRITPQESRDHYTEDGRIPTLSSKKTEPEEEECKESWNNSPGGRVAALVNRSPHRSAGGGYTIYLGPGSQEGKSLEELAGELKKLGVEVYPGGPSSTPFSKQEFPFTLCTDRNYGYSESFIKAALESLPELVRGSNYWSEHMNIYEVVVKNGADPTVMRNQILRNLNGLGHLEYEDDGTMLAYLPPCALSKINTIEGIELKKVPNVSQVMSL